jgi:hypothetical protein
MEPWHGMPEGAIILQLGTSTDEAGAWLLGVAASIGLLSLSVWLHHKASAT